MLKKINNTLKNIGITKSKYIEINQVQLAKAIAIKSPKILEEDSSSKEQISPDIKVEYYSVHGCIAFYLHASIYVKGYLTTNYRFSTDYLPLTSKVDSNSIWELSEKEILFPLPNEIAEVINKWSEKVISEYNKALKAQAEYEKHKKELRDKEIVEAINKVADKYRRESYEISK